MHRWLRSLMFRLEKRGGSYDVYCPECGMESVAWDYLANARMVGWYHLLSKHVMPVMEDMFTARAGWRHRRETT